MKKLISVMLLLAMVLGLFAGCGKDKKANPGLESAAEYLKTMYQTAGKDEAILITADQDVLKSVVVDGVSYGVEWTVEVTEGDAESVTVSESSKENHVKLDIPLHSGSNILFTATATISDAEGNTNAVTFNYMVEGVVLAGDGMTMEELVEAAYNLDEGEALEGLGVLTGVVSMINTPYDEGYKNLTVTIVVGELTDMPIKCYRLKGEGAETIEVGDTITVSGTLKNYSGTIEFDAGCMLDELVKGDAPAVEPPADPMQIVQEAYALEDNASLAYSATLTGKIVTVDTPYDAGYQNITVTIAVTGCEDMPIKCYRLKGDGADTLAVGTEITVTGILTKYMGTVEFAQGCTLDAIVGGGLAPTAPTDPLQIVDEAYLLATDTALEYQATLTGKITSVDTPYDATYQNITVTMIVIGRESKPIKCFRLKGTGVDTLAVDDTITVTGTLKNYAGSVQFDAATMTAVVKGTATTTPVEVETDPLKIIDAAYALAENAELPYNCSLTGKISEITDAYDANYKNISVTIKVGGRDNKPIICYRMSGSGVDKLAVGDTVTVVGKLKNYYGKVQLINCTMTGYKSGGGSAPVVETDPMKIVDVAYGLAKDTQMSYDVTLTGRVSAVKTAYDSDFQNVTVEILVTGRESKPILCYRMKGTGVESVAVGDTIQVAGRLKNYGGTIEFDAGCTMLSRKSGGGTPVTVETDPAKIMAAAAKLAENEQLPYKVTLSGKVTSVEDAYNEEYQNVTVIITVSGANQSLKLYGLKGDGVNQVAVGDTITVEGNIKNYYGTIELVSGTMTARTSGGGKPPVAQTDYKKIVDEAYALQQNTSLAYEATLEGRITELQSPYDAGYGNMTVAIVVVGREDKPIVCYRMKGDSIGNHLCVGDTIKVTGKIKNYNGTVEFDAGCEMVARTPGSASKPTDSKKIVDAAFALGENQSLPYFATLTGVVKSIDEPYTEQYKNVTLTMTVQGTNGSKEIKAYRMKGNDAANVAVGNTITVTGAIKNYVGTDKETGEKKPAVIEFDSGCMLESLTRSGSVSGMISSEIPASNAPKAAPETNAQKILTEAYALESGETLSYTSTLTGKITSIKDMYNPSFGNISVWMEVPGYADKPILAYRVKGEGAENLLVDDTITVTGEITNYNGTIEFKQGCTLDKVVPGGGTAPVAPEDPKQIVAEAYALKEGSALPYKATLTGVITEVGTYNETYGDITVKMVVEGKEFECYALKGENVQALIVGDTITVTGTIKNYYGKIEFDKPNLDAVVKDNGGNQGGEVPVAQTYYLVGYINGADVGIGGDSANMGDYKFVDGKVSATFTADSYVIVKTETAQYSTKGWLGMDVTSATLYTDGDNKLYVPANKPVVFTVTENADGTLTLSYAEDQGNQGGSEDENDTPSNPTNPTTPKEIMDAAYALESGETLEGTYTLKGAISTIDTPWSDQYSNITVSISVEGKALKCFRLAGEGAKELAVGDIITVTGSITNYNGSIQFAQGCTLDEVIKMGNVTPVAPEDPKQIVDEAYALEPGAVLPYEVTLTGKLTEIVTAYDESFKNITVNLVVEGKDDKPILCYRLKGEGADTLKVGDIITVTGNIKNYTKTDSETGVTTNTIEFTPCTLTAVNAGTGDNTGGNTDNNGGTTTDKTQAEIVDEAYALGAGEKLGYTAVLTGKIISVDTAWSDQYGNITVTIEVAGKEDKPIQCYRLAGDGAKDLKVGDTITVSGILTHYVKNDETTGEVVADKIEFEQGCTLVKDTGSNGNTDNNGNTGNTGNSGNTGNTGNTGNSGSTGSTGTTEQTPTTGDFMLTGLFATIALAGTALVVLKKKED